MALTTSNGAEAEIKGGWPEGARGAAASGTARTNRHHTRTLSDGRGSGAPALHCRSLVPVAQPGLVLYCTVVVVEDRGKKKKEGSPFSLSLTLC